MWVIAGLIVWLWPWWLIAVAAGLSAYWVYRLALLAQAAVDDRRARRAEILVRAEQQHRWWMQGDPRGSYGDYPPADIRCGNPTHR